MSTTIEGFQRAAQLNPRGELQLHGQEAENRGTIGNQVARFFRTVGGWLGLCQKPPAQQQRQQAVMDAFTQALKTHYGEGVAQKVAPAPGSVLTGANANQALTAANELRQQAARETRHNRSHNDQQVARMLPGEYLVQGGDVVLRTGGVHAQRHIDEGVLYRPVLKPEEAEQHFRQLMQEARVPERNMAAFDRLFNRYNDYEPKNAMTLYKDLLTHLTSAMSKMNTIRREESDVKQDAVDCLEGMRKLNSSEEVAQAHQAVQDYSQAFKDILTDLAHGHDAQIAISRPNKDPLMGPHGDALLQAYTHVQKAFNREDTISGDFGTNMSVIACGKALASMPREDRIALVNRLGQPGQAFPIDTSLSPRLVVIEAALNASLPAH